MAAISKPLPGGRSPRGRGRPALFFEHRCDLGSIPAWAGETPKEKRRPRRDWVDPRVGGGDRRRRPAAPVPHGRSPRGRGRRHRLPPWRGHPGSIPAWAGETRRAHPRPTRSSVDPRVGGGDSARAARRACRWGRSPRGRGRQGGVQGDRERPGSIPAWAGETAPRPVLGRPGAVDPRVGGGDPARRLQQGKSGGRSPRGRGRPITAPAARPRFRSIPAWAGETGR